VTVELTAAVTAGRCPGRVRLFVLVRPDAAHAYRPPRWEDRIQRAVANRRIFPFLVLITAGLAVLAGFLVTIIDRKDFPDFGTGVWWAVVTLGTVGYGDVVPHTGWGRVIGGVVIVVGVTFVTFLVAIVTSYFIAAEEEEKAEAERAQRASELAETRAILTRIEQRLTAIEAQRRT
jgi:voltage-gated potassium channel